MPLTRPSTAHERVPSSARALPRLAARTIKQPRDTAEGCRDHAAAELSLLAVTADGAIRRRLERSAAAWAARAELLARGDADFSSRRRDGL